MNLTRYLTESRHNNKQFNKVITTMVIRTLDDPTRSNSARFQVVDFVIGKRDTLVLGIIPSTVIVHLQPSGHLIACQSDPYIQ